MEGFALTNSVGRICDTVSDKSGPLTSGGPPARSRADLNVICQVAALIVHVDPCTSDVSLHCTCDSGNCPEKIFDHTVIIHHAALLVCVDAVHIDVVGHQGHLEIELLARLIDHLRTQLISELAEGVCLRISLYPIHDAYRDEDT